MQLKRIAVAMLAIGTLAITACGSSDDSGGGTAAKSGGSNATGGEKVTIEMVTHGAPGDAFWNVVKKGAEDAAKDYNVSFHYSSPDKSDAVEEARLVEAAIAKKPDGIAVSIFDADALAGPIKKAVDAGIPVISLNSGGDVAAKLGTSAHIGQNEDIAGTLGGRKMGTLGVKHVLCVNQEQGNRALELRCQGITKGLSGAKVDQLVIDGSDPTGSQRRIEAKLSQDSSVDGIFTLGPTGFTPASNAIKKSGKQGKIKFATFDLSADILNAVKAGETEFAIDQQPYLQGYLPIQFLAMKKRLGVSGTGQVLSGPNFVTKDNAAQTIELTQKGLR
jgi:simple sugar transport system substrate-binding protein